MKLPVFDAAFADERAAFKKIDAQGVGFAIGASGALNGDYPNADSWGRIGG